MSYGWYNSNRGGYKKRPSGGGPRKRMKFGQTWWGEQWLNALAKIDFSNRLPRGRAYAGNGSVSQIEIEGQTINAKVQGTQRLPYKITINLPAFKKDQKNEILSAISGNPLILAQLLNREIPQELYRLAMNKGIRIFPSSWKDLSMKCSCPDWAVPCKHLAAVIYLISNEIDANPFTLFSLKGLDLIGGLKEQHAGIEEHAAEAIPAVESFLVQQQSVTDGDPGFPSSSLPDFSTIPDQTDRIFTLLSSNPLFYTGDFKALLRTAYKTAAKYSENEKMGKRSPSVDHLLKKIESYDDTMILLDQNLKIEAVLLTSNENNQESKERITWDIFIELLEALETNHLENCNTALRGIALHRRFAIALAKRGAFIPQFLTNRDHRYLIRYLPAEADPTVKSLCATILPFALPETVWIWGKPANGKEKYFPVTPEENSRMMVSCFLQSLIQRIQFDAKFLGKSSEAVPAMFFLNAPAPFSEISEKHLPNIIQLWLKRLSRSTRRWQPVIRIEERNNEYFLDILVVDNESEIREPIAVSSVLAEPDYRHIKLELLRDLSSLTEFLPDLGYYLKSSGHQSIRFMSHEFVNVFQQILPTLRMLGIEILMPKALEKLLIPKPSLRLMATSSSKNISFVNLQQMLDFDYQVAIGEHLMSVEEFRKAVIGLSGIVRIKDQYVLLDPAQLEKIFNRKPAALSANELIQTVLSEEYNGAVVGLDPKIKKLIAKLTQPEAIPLPEGINATLRPYQLTGYRWMVKQSKIGFGSLIADDMGLGKTLQVISLLLKFKEEGRLDKEKALVVVPTTLLTNWMREIARFAPSLRTAVYHGAGRDLNLKECDILITTYGMVRSDLSALKSKKWLVVVVDEAQNIKNNNTDQTKAVKSIKSPIRIAMSGTPVENRLSEYWSIMDFVFPGYLGSEKAFTDKFANPIQLYHDKEVAGRFRKITAPFILRRMKTDKSIISDLPDKVENNLYCSLTRQQAALYQNVLNLALQSIGNSDGIQRKGLVLKMITSLKQICNHPDNFMKKGNGDPDLSGKAQALMELLGSILDSGEKALLFTQYREMGDLLVPMIEQRFGTTPLFLHGGTTRKKRDEYVEEFQNKRNRRIFVLSLKAGGTGLNLTAASHVIHYDFWWNPAVEAQATDRAFRIGQHKNVMVNRMLTQGTFEEKIDEMLKSKKELANLTVSSGENWIGNLSDNELKELFRLEKY